MLRASSSSVSSGSALNNTIISSLASNVILPCFNNAMARGRGGNTAGAKVMIIGDSTDVMGFTGGIPQGWGSRLANQLHSSAVCNASFESVYAMSGTAFAYTDSRVTIGGSWTEDATITSIGGSTYKASTTTNSYKFVPSIPTDTCRIQYITQSGGGTISLSWSAIGGGGGTGTVSVSTSGTDGVGFLQLDIGSLQVAEFHIKYVSGGQVNFSYIEAWDSTRQPVRFLATARGATGSDDWSDDTHAYSQLPAMIALTPDVIILGSLVNDMGATDLDPSLWAAAIATSKTAMEKILNQFLASANPPDIIIRTQNPQNPAATPNPQRPIAYQDQYVAMVKQLAVTYGAVLVDVYGSVISYARGSTQPSNFYTDTWVHLSATGMSTIANQMMVPFTLSTGAGNGYAPQPFFNSVNLGLDLKLRNSTILRSPGAGSLALAVNAIPTGTGAWNIGIGDNSNANGGGNSNVAVGYNALSAAGFKLNTTVVGKDAGLLVTSGSYNTLLGCAAASTVLTTGSSNIIIAAGNVTTTTPANNTSNFINIGNTVKGVTTNATNGGLSITGVDSQLGVLIGANLNITTDNTIPITISGSKYRITEIIVTNASKDLSASIAAGGVYTGTSKSGTTLVAAAQTYTTLSAATKVLVLTLTAAATADTFTATNLYLSLTTADGSAATADIFVRGIPMV